MMQKIVECVPNFSNGRNPEIYNAIADAVRAVSEVKLLNISADPNHNRTVLTFVGSPAGVEQAAFNAIKKAKQLINLDEHTGDHQRIGATDVCPFIPIRGVTRDECVQLAQRLGKRVGEELDIAVYMYGFAATRKKNRNLADIREGEYEQWKRDVGNDPKRNPDFGPAKPAPWGATVIGVRPFLIAYNVYLNVTDVEVARRIARNIREANGGLRNIHAKGFLVDGYAQVSMNLLNFKQTPIHRVTELIRSEAAYFGATITKSEIVGLTPQQALIDTARWYLQAHDLEEEQILEYRLLDVSEGDLGDFTPRHYLEATASSNATPAGGSASALVGALAASLTQMVAGLTMGKKSYAHVQAEARAVLEDATELREQLTSAIVEDAAAFDQFLQARQDAGKGDSAAEHAVLRVIEVPLKVARLSRDVAILANSIAEIGNKNAVVDAATAAIMARAAVQTAVLNVRANSHELPESSKAEKWKSTIQSLETQINELTDQTIATAERRGGF